MSNRNRAEALANRPYITVTSLDKTTNGNPIYIAYSPEVKHCFGQGYNMASAQADLLAARTDLFESMLDDGLAIPEPRITLLSGGATMVIDLVNPWGDVGVTR